MVGSPIEPPVSPASAAAGTALEFEPTLEDRELVERLRSGDTAAFRALVDRFHPSMLRLARAIAHDGEQDIVQETWAAVIDGLERFEARSSLRTWVFRILTNRANSWAKRNRRALLQTALDAEIAANEPAVDPARFTRSGNWASPPAAWLAHSPEEVLLRLEEGTRVLALLSELPPAQRVVVTLRDLEGLPSLDVCAILGLSEANQRVLLHRGRAKLRSALERCLAEPSP